MLDTRPTSNKHDVKIARIRRTQYIVLAVIGLVSTVSVALVNVLFP